MARLTFSAPKWKTVTGPIDDDIARAASAAMDQVTDGLKTELRGQITAAGMGARLANSWQGRRYPPGRSSTDAAAFVWSKAPDIIDAFDRGAVIVPVHGAKYLAIPTANVPKTSARGSARPMTPQQVETYFNQDLKFARSGNGRLIAYVDVTGTSGGSFRRPTGKQLGRLYRGGKAPPRYAQVVMFILTPAAHMPKRLSVDDAAQHWAAQVETLLDERLEQN